MSADLTQLEDWELELIAQIGSHVEQPQAVVLHEALRRGLDMLRVDVMADCRNGENADSLLPPGWRETLFRGIRAQDPEGVGKLMPELPEIPEAAADAPAPEVAAESAAGGADIKLHEAVARWESRTITAMTTAGATDLALRAD